MLLLDWSTAPAVVLASPKLAPLLTAVTAMARIAAAALPRVVEHPALTAPLSRLFDAASSSLVVIASGSPTEDSVVLHKAKFAKRRGGGGQVQGGAVAAVSDGL